MGIYSLVFHLSRLRRDQIINQTMGHRWDRSARRIEKLRGRLGFEGSCHAHDLARRKLASLLALTSNNTSRVITFRQSEFIDGERQLSPILISGDEGDAIVLLAGHAVFAIDGTRRSPASTPHRYAARLREGRFWQPSCPPNGKRKSASQVPTKRPPVSEGVRQPRLFVRHPSASCATTQAARRWQSLDPAVLRRRWGREPQGE